VVSPRWSCDLKRRRLSLMARTVPKALQATHPVGAAPPPHIAAGSLSAPSPPLPALFSRAFSTASCAGIVYKRPLRLV
jgi:hypothetical protein